MFAGVLFSIKLLIMSSKRSLPNALVRFMKHIYAGVLNSIAFSYICLTIKIGSIVDLFLLNPCCSSQCSMSFSSLFFSIPVISFNVVRSSVIPLCMIV